jgi:hypothetical protein
MTNASAVPEAGPAQAVSPRGRFFTTQEFHYETLRNAGYIASGSAELGEVLETVKVIAEGDVQSWYTAWKATADRVLAPFRRAFTAAYNAAWLKRVFGSFLDIRLKVSATEE